MKLKLIFALLLVLSSNLAWAKSSESKIKNAIDGAAESLKKGVEKCGDKIEDIQDYLYHYDWKGLFHVKTTSGITTVSEVRLNGHPRVIVVKPGERIKGHLKYTLDKKRCKDLKYHRILLGIKGEGAQTTIGTGVGIIADKESKDNFVLIAPKEPGLYQVRFKSVENYTESEALKKWYNEDGKEPSGNKTIGFIYVK